VEEKNFNMQRLGQKKIQLFDECLYTFNILG
jgi:hypothetical protein